MTATMASKFPAKAMNLRQFLLRQEVLKLYRDIQRTLKKVSDEKTRKELAEWARSDFKKNKAEIDEYVIKGQIRHGKQSFDSLQVTLGLAMTRADKVLKEMEAMEAEKQEEKIPKVLILQDMEPNEGKDGKEPCQEKMEKNLKLEKIC